MTSLAFFNNKGGVGKTSLIYHIGWMLSELEYRVLMVDLDPQSNLSFMSLGAEKLEKLWIAEPKSKTIYGAIEPLFNGTGDIEEPHIELLNSNLGLIVGHLDLSRTEDDFTFEWSRCLEGKERAFRVITAFWRAIKAAAQKHQAEFVLIDVSPSLGAINRAALLVADYIITPVVPDLFSIQGLKNLGPALKQWRNAWSQALKKAPQSLGELPKGFMNSMGYVIMQFLKPHAQWPDLLPKIYNQYVLDPHPLHYSNLEIGQVSCYKNLIQIATETKTPMFMIKNEVLGVEIKECYDKFKQLTESIVARIKHEK